MDSMDGGRSRGFTRGFSWCFSWYFSRRLTCGATAEERSGCWRASGGARSRRRKWSYGIRIVHVVTSRVAQSINANGRVGTLSFGCSGGALHPQLSLEMGCENVVGTVQVAILSSTRSCARSPYRYGFRMGWNFYNLNFVGHVWYAHVVQAVVIVNVSVVEPWAVACLPGGRAYHAKLCCTAAVEVLATQDADKSKSSLPSHVVTAFL